MAEYVRNREEWERQVSRVHEKTFLQSFAWGEFQESLGHRVFRLAFPEGLMQAVLMYAKRGNFLLVPHGPLSFSEGYEERHTLFSRCTQWIRELAEKEGIHYARIAPVWGEGEHFFREFGWRPAPIHVHPELTWELGLTPSEDELLSGMRKTTRYLIRKGMKEGEIRISQSSSREALDEFYRLHEVTVARQRFTPFSHEYLRKELEAFAPQEAISVFLARKDGAVHAGAVIVFWQGTAFYHHGASLADPKVPASYLLQWEVIREAKKRGCTLYNFWGVVKAHEKDHPWHGLSLFKRGFGGKERSYVRTHDLPFSLSYWGVFALEKWRKFRKRL